MLTEIRIDNRLNGFLGHPGGTDNAQAHATTAVPSHLGS